MPTAWPYRAPRVAASEGQISDDEDWISDSERDLRHSARRNRPRKAPTRAATDGLRSKDLNRMTGRLRDRQGGGGGRSRSQAPQDYDLYSDPRATDGYAYPRYPGPPTAHYEAAAPKPAPYYDPYGRPSPYGNPFGSSAPPAIPTAYPPYGGDLADGLSPFAGASAGPHPNLPPGPQPRRPRMRPHEDTDVNRMNQGLRALKLEQDMQREEQLRLEEEEEAENYRIEERRRRKKAAQAQRQRDGGRRGQDDMEREIERQVLERYSRRASGDAGLRGSNGRDLETTLRDLIADARGREYPQGRQDYRADDIERLIDLLRNRDRLQDSQVPLARLLDEQTGSADRDRILRRLDDMMYHQRRIEETVGELLYRVDTVSGRVVNGAARLPNPHAPRLPEIERVTTASSSRQSRDEEIQSLRHSLQHLPMSRDPQVPLPPDIEELLSKQSTEATLQALRHRSRPGSPVGSDEYPGGTRYRDTRRKGTKVHQSRGLRQRMHPNNQVEEDTEDILSDESGQGYGLVQQRQSRRPVRGGGGGGGGGGRAEDIGIISAADEVAIETQPARSGRRPRGLRIRPATAESAIDLRGRSRSRPVEVRNGRRSAPIAEFEESDDDDDESWGDPNPFSRAPSRAPSQHYAAPSRSASRPMRAGTTGVRRKPRAPSPPPMV